MAMARARRSRRLAVGSSGWPARTMTRGSSSVYDVCPSLSTMVRWPSGVTPFAARPAGGAGDVKALKQVAQSFGTSRA